MTSLENWEL